MQKSFQCPVILLYGVPACGKLTVAKALSEQENLFLLDNHHFNDVVMPFVDVNENSRVEISSAVYQIRSLALKIIQKYKKETAKGFVFSNVLFATPDDEASVQELENFAKNIHGIFVPIHLVCDVPTLLKRIDSKDRHQKCKLTDGNILLSFLKTQKMLEITHPNLLTLNSAEMSVNELVFAICAHLEKLKKAA